MKGHSGRIGAEEESLFKGEIRHSLAAIAATLLFVSLVTVPARGRPQNPSSLPVLTTAEQIRELSPDQARRGYPVRIRGVVTYCDPLNGAYFVQDSTAGIFVNDLKAGFQFKPGQLLEVEGVSEDPDFAPQIGKPRYRVLGQTDLPHAKRVSLDTLESTGDDSQWVELEGVVHDASSTPGQRAGLTTPNAVSLELAAGGGHVTVTVLDAANLRASRLIDATVRVRGVATTIFNQKTTNSSWEVGSIQ